MNLFPFGLSKQKNIQNVLLCFILDSQTVGRFPLHAENVNLLFCFLGAFISFVVSDYGHREIIPIRIIV